MQWFVFFRTIITGRKGGGLIPPVLSGDPEVVSGCGCGADLEWWEPQPARLRHVSNPAAKIILNIFAFITPLLTYCFDLSLGDKIPVSVVINIK
jgi:hypothetical protein